MQGYTKTQHIKTMKHIKYFLYITFIFIVAAGISACSQQKESQAKSTDAEPVNVTMYKNPDCQCCLKWAAYMEDNGFSVTQKPTNKLASVKYQYGVPNNLGSCHTALVDGYVVEGHVPVEAINKLLKERPDAKGVAVAGMPASAPGTQGKNGGPYEVFVFDGQGNQSVYGTYE